MDSVTQIVLGAAVGEVVLGKKIGNRAMIWGAIGGTIPDLDIIVNLFADDMTALAAHRGLSHSFFFAFVGSILFAYLTHKLFSSGLYQKKWYKGLTSISSFLFVTLFGSAIYWASTIATNGQNPLLAFGLIVGLLWFGWTLFKKYFSKEQDTSPVSLTYREWYWFYFWTICTHFLLDAFTSYGTQVFQPFSNYKVAFNTISVADPLYTVPFLICLIIASRYLKNTPRRARWNWAGITVSCAYLLFTVVNKINVDQRFERKFTERGIQYERFTAGPSILNNALWTGTAEGDTVYYSMMMSIFDDDNYEQNINVISKNHELIEPFRGTRELNILEWFTNGFYTVSRTAEHEYRLSDLRYGAMQDTVKSDKNFVFQFIIDNSGEELKISENRNRSMEDDTWKKLWTRIKGYSND